MKTEVFESVLLFLMVIMFFYSVVCLFKLSRSAQQLSEIVEDVEEELDQEVRALIVRDWEQRKRNTDHIQDIEVEGFSKN